MAMLNNQRVNSDLWSIEVLLELSSKNYSFLLHWINNLELSFLVFYPYKWLHPSVMQGTVMLRACRNLRL